MFVEVVIAKAIANNLSRESERVDLDNGGNAVKWRGFVEPEVFDIRR